MIEALQDEFGIPGAVAVAPGRNRLPKMALTHASGAGAEIYLHGAHVTAWTTAEGDDLFFMSRESAFAADKPIRGGIPVIFPQFGGGPLPPHGLARLSDWTPVRTAVLDSGAVTARFRLADSPASLARWPHPFTLTLDLTLDARALAVAVEVANSGTEAFACQVALHTYFRVADIMRTALHGLEGVTFIDSLREDRREVETRPALRFAEETDRIYMQAPDRLRLEDEGRARTLIIEKREMPDVVVWNPWTAKAQRMPDFGDDEYPAMLCVETGVVAAPFQVAAGARWRGETRLSY